MRFIGWLLALAGLLLMVLLAVPLIVVQENIDGLQLQSSVEDSVITVTLNYTIPVKITDYTLKIMYNGTVLNETKGEVIEQGDVVKVSANYTYADFDKLSIVFSGKIAGIYRVELVLHT
ncbi:MAG: hypothetical protein F7C35_09130 [Desulfurococcales archaeon]|nr:hypothetical protein [Desulfurococcales archaeon]